MNRDTLADRMSLPGGSEAQVSGGISHYWQLFEFAPEAYVVSAPDGAIREANRLARQLLEVDEAQLVGASLFGFLVDCDREAFARAVNRLIALGWPPQPVELIAHFKARTSPTFVVQLSASALGRDASAPDALAWVIRPLSPARDPNLAAFAEAVSPGTREVTRQVDVGLLPVVGAVGLSLRYPDLPPELKLALAQAAVSLDSAVQWMEKLDRRAPEDILPLR